MRDMPDTCGFETTVRRAWAALVREELPKAARGRDWPVTSASGFERVLLDHVFGKPWESVIAPPSARNAEPLDLILAIEMGEQLLVGEASISELNRRSLALRAERTGSPRSSCCAPGNQLSLTDDAAADLIRQAVAAARKGARRNT